MPEEKIAFFRPSTFYYRQGLRDAETREQAIEVGMVVAAELESLKAWVRSQGLVPPRFHALPAERIEKQLDLLPAEEAPQLRLL